MRASVLAPLTLVLSLGCAPDGSEVVDGQEPLTIKPGSPEAYGVLDLVNDPDTTFELLDVDVGLDRRAAANIMEARPFETIEALDRVKYVGAVALERLLAFARAHGRVPEPEAEDALILEVVNAPALTLELLDVTIGLDVRAARNILSHRQGADGRLGTSDDQMFESVSQLDDVAYVGPRALQKILEYARTHGAPEPEPTGGALCESNEDCTGALRCTGVPHDGSSPYGLCVDTRRVSGEGDQCDRYQPCSEGTLCAGFTLWGEGTCVPQWMAGRFSHDDRMELPDGARVSSSVVVNGLASVPVDITLTLRLSHSRAKDLRVTLSDPNGDEAVLWTRSDELESGYARSFVTTGVSRDDQVNGRWTLTLEDLEAGAGNGELQGWELFIVSRYD